MKKKAVLIVLGLIIAASIVGVIVLGKKHTHVFNEQVAENEYFYSEATCTQKAKYYYSCKCGEKGTETFEYGDALDHKFTNYISGNDATCTKDGTKTAKCIRCDKTDTVADVGSMLNHDEITHEAKAATCTESGWDEYKTCKNCSYTTYIEIPAKGHTEVVDPAVAATRTEDGLTEGKHCSECDLILIPQQKTFATGSLGLAYSVNTDGKTCVVTGIGTCTDVELIIPKVSPNGYLVVGVGDSAFKNNNFTSVALSDNITIIGEKSFFNCTKLL